MVAQALILLLVLILPLSALLARRMPVRTVIVYAMAWIGVFALGWLIASNFT
ncbi:hypothetical protein [Sphingomonas adhaesiva]|uniref:hypothetical protein n=1 Tax=Sphingomonas adhaesiva TaxID=28212 RepID=UPI002FFABEDE